MTKEDFDEIRNKIHSMSIEELEKIAKEALDEAGIEYSYGNEGIVFSGLIQQWIDSKK